MVEFNKEGLRTFYNEVKAANFYIINPTAEDVRSADWEYSKSYTNSLVAGIATASEMTDILRRRGIIGPEFDKRSEELSVELALKVEALSSATSNEEKVELATAVAIAREELFSWSQRLHAPLSNTCEQIADDTRLEHLTSCLIVDEGGNKVWENFKDYLTEPEQALAQQSRLEVMLYLQGLESDFLDRTPEAVVMREVEADTVAQIAREIAEATAEAGEVVELEAEVEETPVVKKRATRKSSSKKD